MAQTDIPMPQFGRSGGAATGDSWADVDNFDVDMLAEYLLDDGALGSGVTFDFKYVQLSICSYVACFLKLNRVFFSLGWIPT